MPATTQRADGRRNRERIVAAASVVVDRDGAQASLEEIARQAGVGSATLHRHFPSRHALLDAVFRDGVGQLCASATTQPGIAPGADLAGWLEELTVYSATHRGLGIALLSGSDGQRAPEEVCCTDLLLDVLQVLVTRAAASGSLRPDVTAHDLMTLSNALASATEGDAVAAGRLLRLALAGVQA